MFLLYSKYLIPMFLLGYLIKKNPFYTTYPAMLPFMFGAFMFFGFYMIKFSRITNHMVHQILMDPTGTELTFVYKNQWLRKMRADNLEVTVMVSQLGNPPQDREFLPLETRGLLFPETYPPPHDELKSKLGYYYLKFYQSQRNVFAIPREAIYVNYEVLCNSFATNIIDFSQAEISRIQATQMGKQGLEKFLLSQNYNTEKKFELRYNEMLELEALDNKCFMRTQEQRITKDILNFRMQEVQKKQIR